MSTPILSRDRRTADRPVHCPWNLPGLRVWLGLALTAALVTLGLLHRASLTGEDGARNPPNFFC